MFSPWLAGHLTRTTYSANQLRACSSSSGGKKLHWRATDARPCKSKRKSLPTWLSDNGDPGNFIGMQEEKIEIIPIRAVFPAFKVLKKHEQTGFGSGVDMSGECLLLCAKFGSFQRTADA